MIVFVTRPTDGTVLVVAHGGTGDAQWTLLPGDWLFGRDYEWWRSLPEGMCGLNV